jgi:DNA-binding HxlR family transcriptional regulator
MDELGVAERSEKRCAVEATITVIGGKWKPILLFHMLAGALRYSELQRRLPRATDRMLTRSLRELEADGLVSRTMHAEVPVRVEYALTTRGRSLVPILEAMSDWGEGRA